MTTAPTAHLICEEICRTEGDTSALAGRLARQLAAGDAVALHGDLGAGKTTFARALIRARLKDSAAEVPSPTFTLLQTYDDGGAEIAHFDLYRVEDPSELKELGWDDAMADSISLIEWPLHAGPLLPQTRLDVTLGFGETADTRKIRIERLGNWNGRLNEL